MILTENLVKEFKTGDKKIRVVDGVSICVKQGERVAIVGPSGSGKSTFLRCLNGLERPTSGSVIFKGEDIKFDGDCNINKIRRHLGMVFQHFNLFPHFNVLENIIFAPVKLKIKSLKKAQEEAYTLLKKVGLDDKALAYPSSLSGGQKQRVAIVRALIMSPDVMLFDEPTSALDPEMVKEVLLVIEELAETGMTMLFVTHEMEFARRVALRVVFFGDGKILEDTSPKEMFFSPKHPRVREFFSKLL
ncbi:MAG: amino acid ABC transporter ATP-binding protein [Oscillospiraceae bacterium]|nr:amino acid ABC transporter ATP-binding protein [Oscillospiraceae bacterium]